MKKEIKLYKVTSLAYATQPDSVFYVKAPNSNIVTTYITDLAGIAIPLKDLQGSALGITSITSNDGTISITGSISIKDLKISDAMQTLINGALQSGDNISELVNDTGYFENLLEKESAENIPSYTPIAVYNNKAYKFDNLNPLHQFAFAGFSINGTSTGEICIIQQIGEINLLGWGLIPNSNYLASSSGLLQLDNLSAGFTKILGYATSADTMKIINEYTTINK